MELIKLFEDNEEVLMNKILTYASNQGYTKYTSTLIEAWRISIQGLTASFKAAFENKIDLEFYVDEIPNNQLTEFGTKEALLHRDRGVTLEMFLTLTKYYRESYVDLILENFQDKDKISTYSRTVIKMFDHIEVSYITEWNKIKSQEISDKLKTSTRAAVNEKNHYLTVFESIPNPLIILDDDLNLKNLNFSAQEYFLTKKIPGKYYYKPSNNDISSIKNIDFNSFLAFDIETFKTSDTLKQNFENTDNALSIKGTIMKILDVSKKTTGYLLSFEI